MTGNEQGGWFAMKPIHKADIVIDASEASAGGEIHIFYACNHATYASRGIMTFDWELVTCTNCKRVASKHEINL